MTLAWPKRTKKITKVVVHQSLSQATLKQIERYHMSPENHITPGVGLPGIAYHYAIRVNGETVQTNPDDVVTWHAKGANFDGLGVCVLGDFSGYGYVGKQREPNAAQLSSLVTLLNTLSAKYQLTSGSIYTHSDFGKPACPGYALNGFVRGYNGGMPRVFV